MASSLEGKVVAITGAASGRAAAAGASSTPRVARGSSACPTTRPTLRASMPSRVLPVPASRRRARSAASALTPSRQALFHAHDDADWRGGWDDRANWSWAGWAERAEADGRSRRGGRADYFPSQPAEQLHYGCRWGWGRKWKRTRENECSYYVVKLILD